MAVLSSRRTAKPRAAKFARKARENERRSREKNRDKLLPPQSPRGFFALARLYYLARSTKTAMLRRLTKLAPIVTLPGLFLWRVFFVSKSLKVNVFASNNF